MKFLTPSTLLDALHWRYATKQFDPSKKIPSPVWEALEDALVLSPSSYGLQPWRFFVVTDPELKAALRVHSWNQSQVTDCSHHVVFAVRRPIDVEFVDSHLARTAEVRGVPVESLNFYRDIVAANLLEGATSERLHDWAARQAYLALGNFLTAAALLGVDACPMEGFDPAKYDEILGLPEKGFHAVAACPAGYRAEGDKYAGLPKIRFLKKDVLETL
ncbi:MAG: NAD(P)H-dependent oxidoreductase [Chthoniobacterales bacterium]|nr:NAD(P)H-dependent oxidoreductase [Chthoniobacterales bacterium]